MILFCDTSALIKLYIVEAESLAVKELSAQAEAVAVSRIAWAEAFAALARRSREVPADMPSMEQAKLAIKADWPDFLVTDVSQTIVELAGEFADTFALRGYDSVQLATARHVQQVTQLPIQFACFDLRLNRAAKLLGMVTPFLKVN
ncbi:type II toxin-antitoxin system VapC family toxin [Candidatus Thiothrix anitrata]|uniref:Ribonuclease VapC n=1 Tax=Candidatus Thiothrix anitrata TaxID=2823902 RepID=A0ABX7X3T3_9GAMM|nr:type II toxin-antitoxin system VapC family toxin [Candidatus Thiothrix anitrata]QTR50545.1 type II toxin-antitoxin system VapC family toxin [Candidatus Thiothrix anitrata]